MKIFALIPTLGRGGAERVVSLLANEWAKEHEVTIIFFGGNIEFKFSENIKIISLDIKINKLNFYSGIIILKAFVKLKKLIENNGIPDIIYGFLETSNLILCLIKWIYKEKIITIGGTHTYPKRFFYLFRILYRLYKIHDGLVVVSNQIRNYYIENIGIIENKVHFIPNPIDINNIIKLSKNDIPDLICRLKGKGKIIITAGRLVKEKNFTLLIKTFSELLKKRNDIYLIILGQGEEKIFLTDLVRELNIEKNVFLPGLVDNPFIWMQNSDIFVSSSINEGWPCAMIEAMVLGLPVVSTDCPTGPAEILENGRYGSLVPINDQDALLKAIEQSLTNIHTEYPLLNNYDKKVIAHKYLDLIEVIRGKN